MQTISLVDFGAAVRYRDENGTCYKQAVANRKGTICTPPYFSRTLRKGLTQSRRDDMETLGYAMLVAGGVYLPWDDCTNKTKITKEQNRLCEELDVVVRDDSKNVYVKKQLSKICINFSRFADNRK